MLKRIISAAVGLSILGVLLVFRDTVAFDIVIAAVSSMAVFEFYRAVKVTKNKAVSAAGIIFCALFVMTPYALKNTDDPEGYSHIFYTAIILAFALIVFTSMLLSKYEMSFENAAAAFCGALIPAMGFSCYILIRNLMYVKNPEASLYMLILSVGGAWLADTGAYFTGTFFGKHKLCPDISPKKSVEGYIGGIVFNVIGFPLLGLAFSKITPELEPHYLLLSVLGLICAVLGAAGDLFASYVKRIAGVKDFGKIMPGHGGILDRFDSVLTVVPAVYMFLLISYKISPVF